MAGVIIAMQATCDSPACANALAAAFKPPLGQLYRGRHPPPIICTGRSFGKLAAVSRGVGQSARVR